jgi:hypothetical protein
MASSNSCATINCGTKAGSAQQSTGKKKKKKKGNVRLLGWSAFCFAAKFEQSVAPDSVKCVTSMPTAAGGGINDKRGRKLEKKKKTEPTNSEGHSRGE